MYAINELRNWKVLSDEDSVLLVKVIKLQTINTQKLLVEVTTQNSDWEG